MITKIMEGSVRAVVEMKWEGLKLDSCSQFNNLSWWNKLLNDTSPVPVLLENCHQGGFDPGMVQVHLARTAGWRRGWHLKVDSLQN